jgi:glutamine synthetase
MNMAQHIRENQLELVRFVWCDLHGMTRGKTLTASAAIKALDNGVGMVSTAMLKDTSDRTVFKVFEANIATDLPGFEYANTLTLHPIPSTFKILPWAHKTGWVQCQPAFPNGEWVPYDTRYQLTHALNKLSQHGLGMVCGLEIEFHIYKLRDPVHGENLDPDMAAWPGPSPCVSLIHPGFSLLSETCVDMAEEPLRIVQHTAQALGLPLLSLEVEFGPSQVEAVFDATDALTAADNMVLFRSAAKQALRRAGYHATFMCRPPFAHIMSSGWHLHQSLVHLSDGSNAMMRDTTASATHTPPSNALHSLSAVGAHYLAGLLAHAPAMTALSTPTVNGYGRFQPNALAPQSAVWGRDNRGAMLRVIGQAGDTATRIENRLGEPAANPYLYMASQIHAGLHGIEQQLTPGPSTDSPYTTHTSNNNEVDDTAALDTTHTLTHHIPSNLQVAIQALQSDTVMCDGFGEAFVHYYARIKASEYQRFEAAQDRDEFQRREYFARI